MRLTLPGPNHRQRLMLFAVTRIKTTLSNSGVFV